MVQAALTSWLPAVFSNCLGTAIQRTLSLPSHTKSWLGLSVLSLLRAFRARGFFLKFAFGICFIERTFGFWVRLYFTHLQCFGFACKDFAHFIGRSFQTSQSNMAIGFQFGIFISDNCG